MWTREQMQWLLGFGAGGALCGIAMAFMPQDQQKGIAVMLLMALVFILIGSGVIWNFWHKEDKKKEAESQT